MHERDKEAAVSESSLGITWLLSDIFSTNLVIIILLVMSESVAIVNDAVVNYPLHDAIVLFLIVGEFLIKIWLILSSQ